VLQPNPDEVAHAFEVPLAFLMNPAHHRRHRFEWAGGVREWFSMPYRERGGRAQRCIGSARRALHLGRHAGMLRNFYRFLLA
jgi:hypothetical protein